MTSMESSQSHTGDSDMAPISVSSPVCPRIMRIAMATSVSEFLSLEMDEAEKCRQRLHAIAEKKRLQEEKNRVMREIRAKMLKAARERAAERDHHLRVQSPSSGDTHGGWIWSWIPFPKTKQNAVQTQSVQTDFKEEEAAQSRNEQPSQILENNHSKILENNTEQSTVKIEDEDKGHEGKETSKIALAVSHPQRSVFSVLEVQLERDLRTGATTIKSMAPLSSSDLLEAAGDALFDEGRRSVHVMGEAGYIQPLEEELSHIFEAVSQMDMQTILESGPFSYNEDYCSEARNSETKEVEQSAGDLMEPISQTHDMSQREKSVEKDECRSCALPVLNIKQGFIHEDDQGLGTDPSREPSLITGEKKSKFAQEPAKSEKSNAFQEIPLNDMEETSQSPMEQKTVSQCIRIDLEQEAEMPPSAGPNRVKRKKRWYCCTVL